MVRGRRESRDLSRIFEAQESIDPKELIIIAPMNHGNRVLSGLLRHLRPSPLQPERSFQSTGLSLRPQAVFPGPNRALCSVAPSGLTGSLGHTLFSGLQAHWPSFKSCLPQGLCTSWFCLERSSQAHCVCSALRTLVRMSCHS